MVRICPKCKEKIRSKEALFCFYCGSRLDSKKTIEEENLVSIKVDDLDRSDAGSTVSGKGKIKSLIIFFCPILLLLIVLAYFVFNIFSYRGGESLEVAVPVEETQSKLSKSFVDVVVNMPSGDLDYMFFANNSPLGVDVFFVLRNPEKFWVEYVEESSPVELEEITDLTASEVSSFLKEKFALIFREDSWAFFVEIEKNKDFVQEKVENISLQDLNDINVEVVGNLLVVSNDVSLMEEIGNVSSGVSLSLAKDAFFVESVRNLPNNGVSLIFYRNVESVKKVLNKVVDISKVNLPAKNAFVVQKEGEKVFLLF